MRTDISGLISIEPECQGVKFLPHLPKSCLQRRHGKGEKNFPTIIGVLDSDGMGLCKRTNERTGVQTWRYRALQMRCFGVNVLFWLEFSHAVSPSTRVCSVCAKMCTALAYAFGSWLELGKRGDGCGSLRKPQFPRNVKLNHVQSGRLRRWNSAHKFLSLGEVLRCGFGKWFDVLGRLNCGVVYWRWCTQLRIGIL